MVKILGLQTCRQAEDNSRVTTKSNQNIRINSRSFSLTTINAQIQYPSWWDKNFGFPLRIEMKFEKQVFKTSQERTPFFPWQSMRFRVGKYSVKFKGQLNNHGSQNPIKQKNTNLKIVGRMVLEIINIIAHNTYKNNIIIIIKYHQHLKGEKGHWKGE